jgi:hypothetical protein
MSMLDLGALSFSDTPDVNGSLVLTTATGLNLGSIIGTAGALTVTGTSSLVLDIADNPVFSGTGGIVLPSGTTAQRPASPVAGTERMNTTLGVPEIYNGTYWIPHGRVLQVVTGNMTPISTTATVTLPTTAANAATQTATQTGALLFTATITPIATTSRILVVFNSNIASSVASGGVTVSVWAGTVNKGVAMTKVSALTPFLSTLPVQVEWVGGTTAAITITAYGIGHQAGTSYFNTAALAYYNGLMVGQYTIFEVA